jgi:hypothetical protein
MDQFVKIKNVGTEVWDDNQKGNPYTIQPGSEFVVPWGTMCVWLGDPEARDAGKNPVRQEEVTRITLRYGCQSGLAGDNRANWEDAIPKLEAYTLDGERLITVCDDPVGTAQPAAAPLLTPGETAQKIAALEQMIANLNEGNAPTAAAVAQSDPAFIPTAPGASKNPIPAALDAQGVPTSNPNPLEVVTSTTGLPPADAPRKSGSPK